MAAYIDSAVANYTSDASAFAVAVPGGVQDGDVAIVQITTASSSAVTFTPPIGSVQLVAQAALSSSRSQAWLVVLSTAPATLSVSLSVAMQGTLAVMFFRGVDTDTPLASSVGLSGATDEPSADVPSVNAGVAGSFIVGGLNQGSGSASFTPPEGWTIRVDGTRRNGILATKGMQGSAGPTGVATWTMPGFNAEWQAWQVALLPAPTEPTDPPVVAELMSQAYPGFTGDIADGAAIYRDPVDPASSVVITTNKDTGGGLYVLNLAGNILSSNLDGAANSVDWRDLTGITGWGDRVLVMTVDRDIDAIRYYWLDRATKVLSGAGTTPLSYEPYGSCLYVHANGDVYAFITDRGTDDFGTHYVYQYLLTRSGGTVSAGSPVRTISENGVMEGLATDDTDGYLFVSREDHGLYRYSAAPGGGSTSTTIDTVAGGNLVADIEDVAIGARPDGKFIFVSSQGDSSYHVYDYATLEHLERLTITRPGGSPQVTGTDGLDIHLSGFGAAFPDGLIVVHDEAPSPSRFAFVDAGRVFGTAPASGAFASPFVFGPAEVAGEAPTEGGFGATLSFGPAEATGEVTAKGAFATVFGFGPATASGAAPEIPDTEGSFGTGFSFGASSAGKTKAEASFTAAYSFGPVAVEGDSPAVPDAGGAFSTGFTFGPVALTGTAPEIPDAEGAFTGSYMFGPSSGGGIAPDVPDMWGSFATSYVFGPATTSGHTLMAGAFTTGYMFGPGTAHAGVVAQFPTIRTLTVEASAHTLTVDVPHHKLRVDVPSRTLEMEHT